MSWTPSGQAWPAVGDEHDRTNEISEAWHATQVASVEAALQTSALAPPTAERYKAHVGRVSEALGRAKAEGAPIASSCVGAECAAVSRTVGVVRLSFGWRALGNHTESSRGRVCG